MSPKSGSQSSNVIPVDDEGWTTHVEEFAQNWNPAEGEVLQGTYTGYKTVEQEDLNNPDGTRLVNLYEITDSEGVKWGVWESHNIALGFQNVSPGDLVRITFIGVAPLTGGRSVKQYRVASKPGS